MSIKNKNGCSPFEELEKQMHEQNEREIFSFHTTSVCSHFISRSINHPRRDYFVSDVDKFIFFFHLQLTWFARKTIEYLKNNHKISFQKHFRRNPFWFWLIFKLWTFWIIKRKFIPLRIEQQRTHKKTRWETFSRDQNKSMWCRRWSEELQMKTDFSHRTHSDFISVCFMENSANESMRFASCFTVKGKIFRFFFNFAKIRWLQHFDT